MFWLKRILVGSRDPDFVVPNKENPYLYRWWILPRNKYLNIYFHEFVGNDEDEALHDHPWYSISFILKGGYYEVTKGPDGDDQKWWYRVGSVMFRSAKKQHRIQLAKTEDGTLKPATTLFITGPVIREWGFQCPKGWITWKTYWGIDGSDKKTKGCP
jgi:hypothetical protein